MSEYPPPDYLPFSQPPTFNPSDYPTVNQIVDEDGLTVGEADARYLKKISDDSTGYDITAHNLNATNNLTVTNAINASTATVTLGNVSCSDLSISSSSYKVARHSSAIINYNGNNAVYLNVSLLLEANTSWLLSYAGTNIYLYQSSPTTVFLSTASNLNTDTIIKNNRVQYSSVTMKGSGGAGVMTYFTPANQIQVSPTSDTTYYLYAMSNSSPPTTTDVLYNPNMNGSFTDPDGYIVLSALRIR